MNKILASFTSSEKNLIAFVLALLGIGYGITEYRNYTRDTMTFSARDAVPNSYIISQENVIPDGMSNDGRIDVNEAGQQLLETLPGIGPSLAETIISHRDAHGPFRSMDDLDKVPGIGPKKLERIASLVEFGEVTAVAEVTAQMAAAAMPMPVNSMVPPTEISPVAAADDKVNINTAGIPELDSLKGVGPSLANRIIQDRFQRGPFRSVSDLQRVKGIGPKIINDNRGRIVVD